MLIAPVAQLDRVPGFEPGGREFESLRARNFLAREKLPYFHDFVFKQALETVFLLKF